VVLTNGLTFFKGFPGDAHRLNQQERRLLSCGKVPDLAGELSLEGDLTIRGATRKVHFAVEGPTPPAKDPWGNTRIAISASTKINRKDFGLTWNAALETGGILVGDEVTITLEVEFVKA